LFVRVRDRSAIADTALAVFANESETIQALRRAYEAFSRGDFDAAIEISHREIEFIRPGGQQPIRGIDAFRAWMEPEALVDQRIEPLEFRVNKNKVLVRQRTLARGAASGIELDLENLAVWILDDDGLVTRVEAFLLHEEGKALEAAGLTE
jgi:ketosteroid isomerase-like protein